MEYRVEKFTFFVSYFQAYERLTDENERHEFLDALLKYAFYGELPNFEDKLAAMFDLIKPNIDKSIKNVKQGAINGAKGGAPTGNENAKKKTTPGLNENKTDKDKEMEKETENGEGVSTVTYDRERTSSTENIDFKKLYSEC